MTNVRKMIKNTPNDAEIVEEDEKLDQKERKKIDVLDPKEIPNRLNKLKKFVALLKKRTNVKKNQRLFEQSARDGVVFDEMLCMIEDIRKLYKRLVAEKKRVVKCRYLMPCARKFIKEHPLTDNQPDMVRLSSGKGVITRGALTTYIYGYLKTKCTRVGKNEYELDEDMKGLVTEVIGEEMDVLGFRNVPGFLTRMLISKVEVLIGDAEKYAGVLEYFGRVRALNKMKIGEGNVDNDEVDDGLGEGDREIEDE
jgi:hypothetical protein